MTASIPEGWSYGPWHDGPDPLGAAGGSARRAGRDRPRRDGRLVAAVRRWRSCSGAAPGAPRASTTCTRAGCGERRREIQRRHNRLDGTLQEVRELLDEALEAERRRAVPEPVRRRPVPRGAARRAARPTRRPPCGSWRTTTGESSEARRDVRADPRPARPRAARSAVRGHEGGDAERTPEDVERINEMLDRPQRAARRPRAGAAGHRRSSSTSSWPSTASSSRRTRRTSRS